MNSPRNKATVASSDDTPEEIEGGSIKALRRSNKNQGDHMNTRIKQAVLGAAIFVAATLGAVTSSEAAVYSGRWDPAFGGIFGDLGWKGSAHFDVPAACLGLTGSFDNISSPCGGGAMQVLDAKLQFYNKTTDPSGLTPLQTLNLVPTAFVNGMSFVTTEGVTELTEVFTGFFDPVKGSIPEARFGGNDYYFHLILNGDEASLVYTLNKFASPGCALSSPPFSPKCGISQTPAHIVFAPAVPEPSTYALFGVGLAALWSLRRHLKSPRGDRLALVA